MENNIKISRIKNLATERAKYAYDQVGKVKDGLSDKEQKEFKSHVKNVPMLIKVNGLAAAFAFVFAKKEKNADYKKIDSITKKWLTNQQIIEENDVDFHKQLLELSQENYRRATREILALYTWLKRYADGMI